MAKTIFFSKNMVFSKNGFLNQIMAKTIFFSKNMVSIKWFSQSFYGNIYIVSWLLDSYRDSNLLIEPFTMIAPFTIIVYE